MVHAGRIPPGEYRYETQLVDGSKEIETFEADEDGRVKNLKIWIEDLVSPEPEPKKRATKTRRTSAKERG
jgi:hypothetical protein